MADRLNFWVVYANKRTRAVTQWNYDYLRETDEDIAMVLAGYRRDDRGHHIITHTLERPYLHPETDPEIRNERFARDERDWFVYPDGTVGRHFHQVYIPALRARVEQVRERLDLAPILIDPNTDNGRMSSGVKAHSFTQWAGLRYMSLQHRVNPAQHFRKVLLQKVSMSGLDEGIHEVRSVDELHSIVDRRIDRHNALHNARHAVEAEYQTLVDRLVVAYEDAPEGSIDYQAFITARAAVQGFNIEQRMSTESSPGRQFPTPLTIDAARSQAVTTLQNAAARRVSVLLHDRHTWSTLIALANYDTSVLQNIITSAKAEIALATDYQVVQSITTAYVARIDAWTLPVELTIRHTTFAERKVDLHLTVTNPAYVNMQLLIEKPTGYDKVSDGLYYSYANDDEEHGTIMEFDGEGLQTGVFHITIGNLPDDAEFAVRLVVRATANSPLIMTRVYPLGTVTGGDTDATA